MLDPSQGDTIADETTEATPAVPAILRSIDQPTPDDGILGFRSYTLFPASRTLLRNGDPVCIGGRAFDLLVILLRNRGVVTSKNAITDYVWPATYLEESNLRFQVAALRRVLGPDADLIKSVPGRGYLLAAEASSNATHMSVDGQTSARFGLTNNPASPRPAAIGSTPAALLEEVLQSVGLLVASYGSLEGFLSALGSHQVPVADSLPLPLHALSAPSSPAGIGSAA